MSGQGLDCFILFLINITLTPYCSDTRSSIDSIHYLSSMKFLSLSLLLLALQSCPPGSDINDIEKTPETVEADHAYANVFQMLDGTWQGEFEIWEDPTPVNRSQIDLKNLKPELIDQNRLQRINTISVTQHYHSVSPYFQRVHIIDTYPKTGKVEESKGVNKVQQGKLWCVVHKPNEIIIHEGSLPNANTIIWQSEQRSPQKIEYFQETVLADVYEIIGYGYYEGDDIRHSPKLWFYGRYERQ